MLQWTTFLNLGLPLLVGSLMVSAPSALIFYFLTLAIVKARRR